MQQHTSTQRSFSTVTKHESQPRIIRAEASESAQTLENLIESNVAWVGMLSYAAAMSVAALFGAVCVSFLG